MNGQGEKPPPDVLDEAIRQLRHDPIDEGRLVGALDAAKQAVAQAKQTRGPETGRDPRPVHDWRTFVKKHRYKLATAAAAIVAVVTVLTMVLPSSQPAYASEQTIEALKHVRYLHVVRRDESGKVVDNRWIELNETGNQIRYRQETQPDTLIVDDGKTLLRARREHNAVILYDRSKHGPYQWIGNPGQEYRRLASKGYEVLEENVTYRGRPAHRIRYRTSKDDFYIDPETKLPIAFGRYGLSYEQPPQDAFRILIPEGVTVVDLRSGAPPRPKPKWFQEEERQGKTREAAGRRFNEARYALAKGDYAEAAKLFESVVEAEPGRNWAWFWLGQSRYALGDYDGALKGYSRVLAIFGEHGDPSYCHLARGLAYAKKGMLEEADRDVRKALPTMVSGLSRQMDARMFDYADDPTFRDGNMPTRAQSVAKMINRLRQVTGQNFRYDPAGTPEHNKQTIAAWEKWHKESGAVRFDFNAELVKIPAAPPPPVHFVHAVARDKDGKLVDERWVELGRDGRQRRYRQDTPGKHFLVVDDRKVVYEYRKDKGTVFVWDAKDKLYQWIGRMGQWLRDLAGEDCIVLKENITYRGRPADLVRWGKSRGKVKWDHYIDPKSKLPFFALFPGNRRYEISYEEPPAGTFKFAIPKGVTVVDKRAASAPSR